MTEDPLPGLDLPSVPEIEVWVSSSMLVKPVTAVLLVSDEVIETFSLKHYDSSYCNTAKSKKATRNLVPTRVYIFH